MTQAKAGVTAIALLNFFAAKDSIPSGHRIIPHEPQLICHLRSYQPLAPSPLTFSLEIRPCIFDLGSS
jgi:hypothetical protein